MKIFATSISPWVGMAELRTGEESIRGSIHYVGLVTGGLLALIGVVVLPVFGF